MTAEDGASGKIVLPPIDPDIDLGEVEPGESYTFPPPERKVVTQAYDLSIQTLLEQWEHRILELPDIQRDYVWDDARASRLIESLLLNIPIPVVYFAENDNATWEIIDGHQRIKSVVRFIKNEFRLSSLQVLGELKGKRFFELPEREQRYLLTRTMRAIVLSPDSHPRIKFEVFERLNTGAMPLNAQELRNSLYQGGFSGLLRNLVSVIDFRTIIGTARPRKRMVDEELILRFFALREGLASYNPSLKIFLNDYMKAMQNPTDSVLEELAALFVDTVGLIRQTLGHSAFRLADREGNPIERAVNRALYDAQMLAFSWIPASDLLVLRSAVRSRLAELYTEEEFLDSIRRATGDRSRTLRRVGGVVAALEDAGVALVVPEKIRTALRTGEASQ